MKTTIATVFALFALTACDPGVEITDDGSVRSAQSDLQALIDAGDDEEALEAAWIQIEASDASVVDASDDPIDAFEAEVCPTHGCGPDSPPIDRLVLSPASAPADEDPTPHDASDLVRVRDDGCDFPTPTHDLRQ